MPAPKTEKEIRGFLGRLQYISRFIARLTDICEPIFRLLRKNQPTVWNDDCQFAFEKIKEYLLSPPVLVPPTPGRPLLLYLSVSDMALGSLVWATRRLRHYMTEYSVHLISRLDPLRYLFDRPALTGRLMRWLVLLTEFDIQYVSQKSIKGSIVADHLASLPTSEDRPVDDDFPDEEFVAMTSLSGWCMYFDGAANQSGYGIGVCWYPLRAITFRGVRLAFLIDILTNNIVEYEACILGLETALELDIRQMEVFGDSNLVLRQIQGIGRLGTAQNRFADALATLASSVDIPIDVVIRPLLIESGTYPEVATAKDRRALRHLATRFVICGDTLYRRSADGMLLLCLDRASADRVMREFVQKCPECQIHGDLIHAPPSELHALTSPWPFSVWIERRTFELRWTPYCRSMAFDIIDLLRIGTDQRGSRGANKNIKRILRKWLRLLEIGVTPYSLVYGMEAVLPIETEMGSLRVALEQQISETEWAQARFDQLNLLDERRLRATDHVQAYQRKMVVPSRNELRLDHCKKGT
ncbi:Retrovirus-related Pol polyprotein from transposon 17.6 [Vitis vinifera]|uniref:Retrovirus-related Pol polyprotein from transposon 17.6 n=1 Tax=Vitis vinifera TaxID=29760 RepID=A0A438CMM7_VITVI|nr:Retrovirus-related Pol polyprotein from transposon 17.6 [Vitis vinifera]